jgi:hypothetical protein
MRIGTRADLARELNISRAAVTQAFKRHNIQLSIDGKFDLDYAAWLLKEKQNQAKSTAQRSATKQLPGLNNPRLKREVIRTLWPIWEEAFIDSIKVRAEFSFEDEQDFIALGEIMLAYAVLWDSFHTICNREFPADIGDFPFKVPDCINFDPETTTPLEQVKNLLFSDESLELSGPSGSAAQCG